MFQKIVVSKKTKVIIFDTLINNLILLLNFP